MDVLNALPTPQLPCIALLVHEIVTRHDLDSGHPALVGHQEVLFQIVEHDGPLGVDTMSGQEPVIKILYQCELDNAFPKQGLSR